MGRGRKIPKERVEAFSVRTRADADIFASAVIAVIAVVIVIVSTYCHRYIVHQRDGSLQGLPAPALDLWQESAHCLKPER